MSRAVLVIGGARSGKSDVAERLADEAAGGGPVAYVATCLPRDEDLLARVAAHRARRPRHWTTVEAPNDPAGAVRALDGGVRAAIVECLSLLVFHAQEHGEADEAILGRVEGLFEAARARDLPLVAVSTDVSAALVPPDPASRRYQDLLGRANRLAAAAADEVRLVVAGLPLRLK